MEGYVEVSISNIKAMRKFIEQRGADLAVFIKEVEKYCIQQRANEYVDKRFMSHYCWMLPLSEEDALDRARGDLSMWHRFDSALRFVGISFYTDKTYTTIDQRYVVMEMVEQLSRYCTLNIENVSAIQERADGPILLAVEEVRKLDEMLKAANIVTTQFPELSLREFIALLD